MQFFEKCKDCRRREEGCQSRCPYYISNVLVRMELKEKTDKERLKRDQDVNSIIHAAKGKYTIKKV